MAYAGQVLKNPASGERITFRKTAADTDGELVAIDLQLPAGRRVPGGLHIHPLAGGALRSRQRHDALQDGTQADHRWARRGGGRPSRRAARLRERR